MPEGECAAQRVLWLTRVQSGPKPGRGPVERLGGTPCVPPMAAGPGDTPSGAPREEPKDVRASPAAGRCDARGGGEECKIARAEGRAGGCVRGPGSGSPRKRVGTKSVFSCVARWSCTLFVFPIAPFPRRLLIPPETGISVTTTPYHTPNFSSVRSKPLFRPNVSEARRLRFGCS